MHWRICLFCFLSYPWLYWSQRSLIEKLLYIYRTMIQSRTPNGFFFILSNGPWWLLFYFFWLAAHGGPHHEQPLVPLYLNPKATNFCSTHCSNPGVPKQYPTHTHVRHSKFLSQIISKMIWHLLSGW